MRLLDEAKQFFWLRRIALALERQNELMEKLVRVQEEEWTNKHIKPLRNKTEYSLMDAEEINKDYLRRLEAKQKGIELDD